MTALYALQPGCDVLRLERKSGGPAINLASHVCVGDWDNPNELINLAKQADVVTLENEFVDVNSLSALEQAGHQLCPAAKSISLVQDKFIQKQTLQRAGLPLAPFIALNHARISLIAQKHGIIHSLSKPVEWP